MYTYIGRIVIYAAALAKALPGAVGLSGPFFFRPNRPKEHMGHFLEDPLGPQNTWAIFWWTAGPVGPLGPS